MTPGMIRAEVVLEKAAWIRRMLAELRRLPLANLEEFVADHRNPAAAESYLRRALEGLLDDLVGWLRDHPERLDNSL